jgi:hypothetical protein
VVILGFRQDAGASDSDREYVTDAGGINDAKKSVSTLYHSCASG